jgi:hypothetical protein
MLGFFFGPEDGGDMFPEKLIDFQWASQHYTPENITLHNHQYENLKLCKDDLFCLCNADSIVITFESCKLSLR